MKNPIHLSLFRRGLALAAPLCLSALLPACATAAEHDIRVPSENASGGTEIRTINITPEAETILDDATIAAMRATLGLVIGTDVLAPTGDGSGLTGVLITDDVITGDGGAQLGLDATASFGGAVGFQAITTTGGAVGEFANATTGGAVGYEANATTGGAVGFEASATTGGAVGIDAESTSGGSVGDGAISESGGAVGQGALSTNGFAGGSNASANGTGRVQLGTGTNGTDSTIQFLSSGSVTAAQFGILSDSDLTDIAALTTTAYGRSLLELADASAGRTTLGLVIGTDVLAPTGDGSGLTGVLITDDVITGDGGAQLGDNTTATSGGAAVGFYANATAGGAVGSFATATYGGAVGYEANATTGGAVGDEARATTGGAVGQGALSTNGFAGGSNASANGTNRVQLGTGTNGTDNTIQFLSSGSVTATQFGILSDSDLTDIAALTTTTYGRSLLELADASAGRTNLGLVIGTDVQAYAPIPVTLIIAASDETTALNTGTAKVTLRAPFAFTLTSITASVTTAPTGAILTVDVNEAGTSLLSTKLTIDATEKTTTTAATAAVISDTAIAADAELTIDIDQVGSTIAGTGLKVTIHGTR